MVILAAMLNTDSSVSSRSHFIRCSWTVVYREGILSYVEGILGILSNTELCGWYTELRGGYTE